ncbi:MAG: UvrD-helicase domain-containing protein [Clostridiales bacterium]|nr:UvrD-helicase domain-containing protein [Clostridiales bacterium]
MDFVVCVSNDFVSAVATLPKKTRGKVTDFINKFRNNPLSLNMKKIDATMDDSIRSLKIDESYSAIIAHQEESNIYLILWVSNHEKAISWASKKRCALNKSTGSIQVYDVIDEFELIPDKPPLFSSASDADLMRLGVPEEQLRFVKSIPDVKAFQSTKESIPIDAYEALEWLANDFPVAEVLKLYNKTEDSEDKEVPDDFKSALETDINLSQFAVIDGEEELRRIMAEPLEKWRLFLHPKQRSMVKKDVHGPYRLLGGAGTGKTVVAMHRAKMLASEMQGKERLLFTTFTANLAGDIHHNLKKICSQDEIRRIETINLDAWISHFLRENGFTYKIVYDDETAGLWEDAISRAGANIEFTESFFADEWTKVVAAQECFTKEKYMKASRVGRGTRLDRKKRMEVWSVFEEYLTLMKEKQVRDVDTAMYECRVVLEKNDQDYLYKHIIVDEGQDFSSNAYRLIRSMAGKERDNDIFIVGDAHQRIYKNKAVLSKCGINIRGRSSYLKINYRTTEEIRKYAFAFLRDIPFDDLDDSYEPETQCQSLTHGGYPTITNFRSASEEHRYLVNEIRALSSSGVALEDICLTARTNRLLDDYIRAFQEASIHVYKITQEKLDDRSLDGVRVATMHRVKGLEFPYMFIAAANSRIIPFSSSNDDHDPIAKEERLTSEKCLLYVALTRAQKAAYITSYGKKSEFLPNEADMSLN